MPSEERAVAPLRSCMSCMCVRNCLFMVLLQSMFGTLIVHPETRADIHKSGCFLKHGFRCCIQLLVLLVNRGYLEADQAFKRTKRECEEGHV